MQEFQVRCFGRNPTAFTPEASAVQAPSDEEDDGLGYYPDGVKRILTDEQVAMFRHSEIQTLLRELRHRREDGDASELSNVEPEERRAEAETVQRSRIEADEEDEYAHFLEQEQEQLRRGRVGKKRKRSSKVEQGLCEAKRGSRRAARKLDEVVVQHDSLDYDDDAALKPPTPGGFRGPWVQMEHERSKTVYDDDVDVGAVTPAASKRVAEDPKEKATFLWPRIEV